MRGRLFPTIAAAALISSCAGPLAIPTPSTIERIDAAFGRLSVAAELLLPRLPASQAVRVRATLATIGLGIGALRAATSTDDRQATIEQLEAQLRTLARVLGR